MTESMSELLAKLKELDPETWSRVDKVLGLVVYPRSPLGHYIIQGVIQDAIAARGWGFYVSTECDNWWEAENISDMEITFAASILLPDDEMYDFWDGLQLEWCRGDSPAEALLRAYNAALEAEREAGR